jgi:creatinine amidohydrolase/Fe(II)-dependent formamide hydrolase-like protein
MKLIFFISALIVTGSSVNAQKNEKWFGLLKLQDGFTDQIVINVKESGTNQLYSIDLPQNNIGVIWNHEPEYRIQAINQIAEKGIISFIIPEQRIYFEGILNTIQTEIEGQFVLNGQPYKITFTKHEDRSLIEKNPTYVERIPGLSKKAIIPDLSMKRPIGKSNSLFTEELTWIEVRDAIAEGKTTIIIATGGIEQNGAYLATGKHNYVLKGVVDSLAHKLGNALIAPIIPFVPEGNHKPPTTHMKYPGTISLTETTYEQLLKEIAISYKTNGFKTIVFLGDSGGNQWGMYLVAKELNTLWRNDNCKVLYIHEYYDNYRVAHWLKTKGIKEVDTGVHDSFQYTSQIMALDPTLVRMNQRIKVGDFSINGVNLLPSDKTIKLGKKLCSYQADICVQAINKRLGK